jgi:hypothetical protein
VALLSLVLTPRREPPTCVIEAGPEYQEIAEHYPLLISLDCRISRAEAGTGKMVFVARRGSDGRMSPVDEDLLTPWSPIRIYAEFGTEREEILRGYVKQAMLKTPEDAAAATFEVEFQDESMLLDRLHAREVWGTDEAPLADKEILEAIAAEVGLGVAPDSHDGQATRPRSQDATAIKLLRERARANGFELLFEAGEIYFGPMRLTGEAQADIKVYAGPITSALSFEVVEDAQQPDAVAFDVAPASGDQPESETVQPSLPLLGRTPVAAQGADLSPFTWRISREGDETAAELRARAQGLADINSMKVRASGELDGAVYGHVLKVAHLVVVDGVGERHGGLYYVDAVEHAFTSEGYRQRFVLVRNATGETDAPSGPLGAAASALGGLF